MGFQDLWVKNGGFYWENRGRGGAILTPNELVLTFGGLHVCVQFGENRRRNATVRVSTDGQTHTRTHGQTQNDFIICPMVYAIARGQIIIWWHLLSRRIVNSHWLRCQSHVFNRVR